MPYDVPVRQYLQGRGVANSDIGYDKNSGNVTVRGQNFYKPELNMANTTYSNQSNLDNAYNNYSKTLPVIQPDGSIGTTANVGQPTTGQTVDPKTDTKAASGGYTNPYTQMIGDLIKHLSETSSAPQQDIYSTPQYAAAKANQDRMSADAIRHSSEAAAGAGLGHSTIMTDRTQRIQNDSDQQLATQLVPQIQAQLEQQRQTELANEQNQLNNYLALSDRSDNQYNSDRTYNQTQAQLDYEKDPNNPSVKNQIQQNQLNQFKIDDYPAEQQANATKVQQDLAAGKINLETAQYNFNQLKDPNSVTNQANKIELQLKQLDLKNAPEKARLEIQQLQKQIADIGVVHTQPQTATEIAMDKVKLETAQEQLKQLQNPTADPQKATDYKTNPKFAEDIAYIKANPSSVSMLDTNSEEFIKEYGYDGYQVMRTAAGLD